MPQKQKAASRQVQVSFPQGQPPLMSNVANVLVTDSQVILDFGFVDPTFVLSQPSDEFFVAPATLISRVVMQKVEAQQLMQRLEEALKTHELAEVSE
jgi:hypothetical protein